MYKQKLVAAAAALTMICACSGLLFGGITASAQEVLTPDNASLFLPQSYEQYLVLDGPVDVALSEKYIAIAEANTLFLYDRAEEESVYHTYTHSAQISKIQFSEAEDLYFSDNSLGFYKLDLSDMGSLEPVDLNTPLSTFLIEGDTIFMAAVTNENTLYRTASLSDPSRSVTVNSTNFSNTPQLAYAGGNFYSVVNELVSVYSLGASGRYEWSSAYALQTNASGLRSVTSLGGMLYFSLNGTAGNVRNGLYTFDLLTNRSELVLEGNGFGALTVCDGKLYAVQENAIRELSVENGLHFTSYEISSASSSEGRLSGARDSVRAGELLVTADSGNSRIAIHNIVKGTDSFIYVSYSPALVATDGTLVVAAAGNTVYTYTMGRNGWEESYFSLDINDTVRGLSCVYGSVYYVSEHHHGRVGDTPILETHGTPAGLAGDLYGNLWIAYTDGAVTRYTEEEFLVLNGEGENEDFRLPLTHTSLRADFEGNLYYLDSEGVMYQNGEPFAFVDGSDYVYLDSETPARSFALGFEDDEVYFNFGNFIVKTHAGALGFPTLGTISAEGVYEEVSVVHAPDDVRYVDVRRGAVGIEVDLASLEEDTVYFPYAAYSRTTESGRGVLLAETGSYCLVALYSDRAYDVRLFRGEQCTLFEGETSDMDGTKFLSSDAYLYNYPCFTHARSEEQLARGSKVRVLSAMETDCGYDFVYVEYETMARSIQRGYLPLSFLADIDPSGSELDVYLLGYLKTTDELVFTAENGDTLRLTGGEQIRIYDNGDGTYTARVTKDGTVYSRVLTSDLIDWGESDAWRIALIIGLSVLAVLIIGAYVWLLPKTKKE